MLFLANGLFPPLLPMKQEPTARHQWIETTTLTRHLQTTAEHAVPQTSTVSFLTTYTAFGIKQNQQLNSFSGTQHKFVFLGEAVLKDTQMSHEKLGCRPLPAYIPQSLYDIHTEEGTAQALHQVQQCQDSSINIKTLPGCGKTYAQMKLNLISTIPVQICLKKMANPSSASHYVTCLRTPEESILHLPVSSWQD